jgi:hypothetical protein
MQESVSPPHKSEVNMATTKKQRNSPKKTAKAQGRRLHSLLAATRNLAPSRKTRNRLRRHTGAGAGLLAAGGLAALGYYLLERNPEMKRKLGEVLRELPSTVQELFTAIAKPQDAAAAALH